MKVVFVYPAYENIGIESLSAVLKAHGHDTELIFDPQLFADSFLNIHSLSRLFDYKKSLIKDIIAAKPDLVAFSLVTDNYLWFKALARQLKTRINVPIVVGGIHPTCVPEEVIRCDFVDFLIRGEGEFALLELVNSLESGRLDKPIGNLWFKRDGKLIKNEVRRLIQDLDSLPFLDKELYVHTSMRCDDYYSISCSRGCPLICTFCNNNILKKIYRGRGKYFRRRSVDNVLAELNERKQIYGFKIVNFYDEIFTCDVKWLQEFSYKYKQEINLPYICCIHPAYVSPRIGDMLKESGCYKVDIGVQCLNEGIKRRILKRPENNAQVERAFDIFKKRGIVVNAENILNLPEQSEGDLIYMTEFYNRTRPDIIKIYWLRYYPGTEITDIALKKGILTPQRVKELERGEASLPIATGGSISNKLSEKFFILFVLLHFLPQRLVDFIIQKKLYRYLPTFNLSRFAVIIMRSLNKSKRELMITRHKRHYRYYILKKLGFSKK